MFQAISHSDAAWCNDCAYFVGVTTVGSNDDGTVDDGELSAQFALTAFMSDTIVRLQDRVPFRSFVRADQVNHYLVEATNKTDLFITLTPISGDPDMYFSYCNQLEHQPDEDGGCVSKPGPV